MANNLNIDLTPQHAELGQDVVRREMYFFTCTKCHKTRRQTLKENRAGDMICRKCRKTNNIPGQTSIFNPEGLPECPKCQIVMNPIWENNGFDGESGPRHDEITGYKCPNCGHEE